MRTRKPDEAAGLGEGAASDECLHPDGPQPPFLIESDIALLLERREQPVRGRYRQANLLREIRQGCAIIGRLSDPVEECQCTDERLHLIAPAR